jgi:hypothetical protein
MASFAMPIRKVHATGFEVFLSGLAPFQRLCSAGACRKCVVSDIWCCSEPEGFFGSHYG